MAKIPDEDFDDNKLNFDNQEEISEGAPEWMVTYGDLVTLLLCFFVLLFSMSKIEQDKFQDIADALKVAIGKDKVPEEGTRLSLMLKSELDEDSPDKIVDELGNLIQKEMEAIDAEVKEFIFENQLSGQVKTKIDDKGYIITVSDMILFRPGSSNVETAAIPLLTKIKELLNKFEYQVRVEGHTDNLPINTPMFPSNWELSTHRACQVVRDNLSPESRAQNRRVEVVFVKESMAQELQKDLDIRKNITISGK